MEPVQSSVDTGHNKATIAFGSNLGDRVGNIEAGLGEMQKRGLKMLKVSGLYETKPMYYEEQGAFLNGVCQVETDLPPLALLDVLQDIENALGRKRTISKGPRTLDLDIILFNHEHIRHERLDVPHKLMLEREFVLRPLADILPFERLPSSFLPGASHDSIQQHLSALADKDGSMSPVTALMPGMPLIRSADVSRQTHVMAILNTTPDSFSDGGSHTSSNLEAIQATVRNFIAAGATIIDIGGQSTRPMAELLTAACELERVLPVVRAIREMPEAEDVAISIDTFYAEVAKHTIQAGADIINDISSGVLDAEMLPTVAQMGKTIVLMHMRGDPHTMTKLTDYPDGVLKGVAKELAERVEAAERAGIPRWRIILDPGIGFAKTQDQNLELLRSLHQLRTDPLSSRTLRGLPWLVGTSRKGFIGKITGVREAAQRTWGTAAAVTASIASGADIVRIHDVKEMALVSRMADAIYRRP